jgi:hypothetical protein
MCWNPGARIVDQNYHRSKKDSTSEIHGVRCKQLLLFFSNIFGGWGGPHLVCSLIDVWKIYIRMSRHYGWNYRRALKKELHGKQLLSIVIIDTYIGRNRTDHNFSCTPILNKCYSDFAKSPSTRCSFLPIPIFILFYFWKERQEICCKFY